jgi:hypothetical protein
VELEGLDPGVVGLVGITPAQVDGAWEFVSTLPRRAD